jgi:predicted DNA-binding WGR domain protein
MDMRKLLEAVSKFAGEPEQKPDDQVKGTDVAKKGSKEHPFKGQLVGDSKDNMLRGLSQVAEDKSLEWELAEDYAKFMEDDLGVEPKRPSRKGSRHARGHEPKSGYTTVKEYKKDTDNFTADDIKELEGITDLATLKERAFALISTPSKKPMKPEKVAWFKSAIERMTSPAAVIKLMWDLLLSGEGQAVIGSRSSMNPNSYRSRFNEEETVDEGRTTWNSDWYVYNPETLAVKKKFRTYKGAKQYAEANGLKLAASEWYHDKINTQKQTDEGMEEFAKSQAAKRAAARKEKSQTKEGWESGPEERSSSRERDPDDAYDDMRQQKADDAAEREQAKRPQEKYYTLTGRGPNMEPNYAFPGEYNSLESAVAARKEIMADPKTPNPRMIGISTHTRYLDLKEGIESTDPVEGAVLAAVQELIQQGHTEVAPEVITNMVVAATSQPFLLKDLVDANKNSSAIQHYVDSINPTKVKFSSDILTVKNENPAKKSKEQAQTGVANMAARAANRSRLGEASTPLRDREDYDAKSKALQDIQIDPSTSQDPQLSAELARRKAELVQQAKQLGISESRAHKLIANKLKQIELQRQMGSPEGDAAYAQHVDSLKKSKEEYLKKTPNTIYKREVDEAGSAVGGGAVNNGSSSVGTMALNPDTVKQTTAALNTFKSATGSNAPTPNIAKALDAVTKGTAVGGSEMKILEPVMKDLATVATDPKLAGQFKSLAGQVNQTQQKQQQAK